MDWIKAKNIVIFMLAAFNIFLLANIVVYAADQGIPRETIQNTKQILAGRGVTLECEIPRQNKSLPMLVYGKGENDKAREVEIGGKSLTFKNDGSLAYIDEKPDAPVDLVHIKTVEKYVRKFASGIELFNSSYIMDGYYRKPDGSIVLNFVEKYKGYLVFDNYLKATVSNKGVTSLEFRYRQVKSLKSPSPDVSGDIVTAYQVLLENFDGSEKLAITHIDIGFKSTAGQEQEMVESSEQPVWRISIKGRTEPVYFGTSDGKEIK